VLEPGSRDVIEPIVAVERQFRLAAGAVLCLAFLVSLYSALEWRSLFADGMYYFLSVLQRRDVALFEPARRTVHVLQQFPTILALRMGVSELGALAVVYGMTLQILPLILTAACYPLLPRKEKALFVFPLAHYLLGTTVAFFAPIVEGPVAAAYFWLLLVLIVFGRTWRSTLATVCLAMPALYLHETVVLLAPILAFAALQRARPAASRSTRIVFYVLAAWFVAVALLQAAWIVQPRSVVRRRDAFLTFLLLGLLDYHGFNVPAVLAVAALAAAWIVCRRSESRNRDWAAALGFGAASFLLVAATWLTGAAGLLFAIWPEFAARNNAVVVSVPLAVLFLAARARPESRALWMRPQMAAVILFLGLGQLGWQALGVHYWSQFVADFRLVLVSHRGFAHWRDVLAEVGPERAERMDRLAWYWTNPALSILLAPGGRVATIIGSVDERRWQPFDPIKIAELPRAAQFDYARYAAALTAAAPK
jgi:hypothetical protein